MEILIKEKKQWTINMPKGKSLQEVKDGFMNKIIHDADDTLHVTAVRFTCTGGAPSKYVVDLIEDENDSVAGFLKI